MMSFKNYQAVLITDEHQKCYFTGFSSEDGYLILTQEQNYFVTDLRYFSMVENLLKDTSFKVVIGKDFNFLGDYLKSSNITTLGVDFSKTTLLQNKSIKKLCPKIVDVGAELQGLLELKNTKEIQNINKACQITQEVFNDILTIVKEGITELELKAEIIYRFLKSGATDVSFDPIVAFAENSAIPHHQSTNKKLVYNSVVLIDMGCRVNGYCSDFTRTFYFGDNPPKDFISTYNSVLEAFDSSFSSIKVGETCKGADNIARQVLLRDNLEFKHSLGHGVGVNIHEKPTLSPSSKDIFKNGMVFSIEPGAYKDGLYGVRIEDLVYINNDKISNFYTATKRLIILDKFNKQFLI